MEKEINELVKGLSDNGNEILKKATETFVDVGIKLIVTAVGFYVAKGANNMIQEWFKEK